MIDLIVASKNTNKVKEIQELTKDLPLKVLGIENGDWSIPEIIEDGKSFSENAIKKAKTVAGITGKLTIADDSGLEVDALGGQPGIYSARFAGEDATDRENNLKLLDLLKDVPLERRTAQFRCIIAIAESPKKNGPEPAHKGRVEVAEGMCPGIIGFEEKGSSGFGYDPLFIYPEYNRTFAELGLEIKNKISHRARALEKAKLALERIIFLKSQTKTTD